MAISYYDIITKQIAKHFFYFQLAIRCKKIRKFNLRFAQSHFLARKRHQKDIKLATRVIFAIQSFDCHNDVSLAPEL